MELKVADSFELEFGYKAEKISINEDIAKVDNKFCCRLNSKGVKKNSWRTINF